MHGACQHSAMNMEAVMLLNTLDCILDVHVLDLDFLQD